MFQKWHKCRYIEEKQRGKAGLFNGKLAYNQLAYIIQKMKQASKQSLCTLPDSISVPVCQCLCQFICQCLSMPVCICQCLYPYNCTCVNGEETHQETDLEKLVTELSQDFCCQRLFFFFEVGFTVQVCQI